MKNLEKYFKLRKLLKKYYLNLIDGDFFKPPESWIGFGFMGVNAKRTGD
jgi:hypothetical protein